MFLVSTYVMVFGGKTPLSKNYGKSRQAHWGLNVNLSEGIPVEYHSQERLPLIYTSSSVSDAVSYY